MILEANLKNNLTVDQAWHYSIVPSKQIDNTLHLLTTSEEALEVLENELEIVLGTKISLTRTSSQELQIILQKNYPRNERANRQKSENTLRVSDSDFLNDLLLEAQSLRSSDIHIETYSETCRIRFRIDGALVDRHHLRKNEYPTAINKVKIAAGCDIGEKRLPQDGRIKTKIGSNVLNVRVSILPTLYGEKIVLRLLGTDAEHIVLENLGLSDEELSRYQKALKKPHGIILISGPTGSGKTTTLYATLKLLNRPGVNILTIEDPVEYTLDGINQVQLKEDIGLSFAAALRTFLRQDPDIIMLGEIRDAETAQMAIRAALTGHLVLSTIHTNSAWGTISRLTEMGVPPYLLANTINLSVAQRLVRTLCSDCKSEVPLREDISHFTPRVQQKLRVRTGHFVAGACPACHFNGYKGRKAIYEVLAINSEVGKMIIAEQDDICDYKTTHKVNSLADSAYNLFEAGETTLQEIYPYLLDE